MAGSSFFIIINNLIAREKAYYFYFYFYFYKVCCLCFCGKFLAFWLEKNERSFGDRNEDLDRNQGIGFLDFFMKKVGDTPFKSNFCLARKML